MIRVFSIVAVLLLTAPFCMANPGELRMRLSTDPVSMDWNIAGPEITRVVVGNIMEGLFAFNANLEAQPALAKSFTLSDDRKTYTFVLREGVKWTDGMPLTAQQFVDSWKRLLDPLDRKMLATYLLTVEGADKYNQGVEKDFSKVGIKALNPSTLEVRLSRPLNYFPQLLALPNLFPIRKDLIEKFGNSWHEPGKIAVLGPFVPTLHEHGKKLMLKRNDKYYGSPPELDTVTINVISDNASAVKQFQAGALDFVTPINLSDVETLTSTGTYVNSKQYRTRFLSFNSAKYPLSLPPIRKAIAMAIDRSKISKALYDQRPQAESLVPKALFADSADVRLPFDLAGAKKLLKDSGILPSAVTIEFMSLSTDENTLVVNQVAEQLRTSLDFKVDVKLLDRDQFISQVSLKSGGIYYFARSADFPDVDSYVSGFISTSGANLMAWKNARYDELVQKAANLPQGTERNLTYKQALKILIEEDAAIVPLHYENYSYLLNTAVKNFSISPISLIDLRRVVIK